MAAVVTEEEKSRARHHMGYPQVDAVSTFALGVPAAMQTTFMIEGAFNKITASSIDRFRKILCRLETIEDQVFCGTDLADVNKIDTIDVNRKRMFELARYYCWARADLGNLLGVPPNPFDMRQIIQLVDGGINARVIG